jgi:predicted nicotinamide N-methyase
VSPAVGADFVRAHTRLGTVPFVPELRLYLAGEAVPLWERTERERGGDQPPPFWAFAWAGGQALARYLLDHPEVARGRAALDLASGSGLVAIAAARTGAAVVTANEIDPYAAAAIAINAAANDVPVTVLLADLLDADPGRAQPEPRVDLVLAGDVCYSRDMTGRVMSFLRRARAAGARVLIGDPGRAYLPRDLLRAVARYEIPVTWDLESAEVKRTTVWELKEGPPVNA